METKEAHVGKMEERLRKWGAKLDEFAARDEVASVEAKAARRLHIDELKAKHLAARAKLDELKAAGAGKWETFRTGVESAWTELEVAFKTATN